MAQKFTVPITVKQLSSAGSDAITLYVDTETYSRLKIEAGGRLTWGSGSANGDVNLYRDGADVLRTDDTFKTPTLFVDNIEIDTTGAQTDYILKFDGTKFTAASATFGGGGAVTFNDLTDVTLASPEKYQTVVYDGTQWINEFPTTVSLVNNAEATTLTVGTLVYLYGNVGNHASVKRADNDSDATSSKTVGMVSTAISAGGNGPVVTRGYVTGMNLSTGYTAGDILWLGEDGGFTKTKPTAPEHLVFVGIVVRATNNGIIYVACQNGYELDELHDVSITSPLSSGQFLKYNGTLWVNDAIDLGTDTTGNYVESLVAGTGITLTNGTASEGGTPTVSVTANTYQPLDADLTAIAGLSGTSGILKKTAADTWALDTSTFVTTADTGTVTSAMIANNTIVDADISTSAAISLSKLSTTGASTGNVVKFNGTAWAAASAGGANVTSSTTPPASPNAGDLWLDSANVDLYIYYDSHWVQLTGEEPLVEDLNDLADVDVPSPAVGNFLKYDGTYWTAASIPTINALDDIGDVSVSGAASGQFLKWNGSAWVPDTVIGGATASSGAPSSPTTGQMWFDTDDARTYVYYDGYWVEVGASGMAATVSDSTPSNPIAGQIWYKSDTGGTYIYYNSNWVEVGAAPATSITTGKAIAMSIVFGG